MTTRMPRADARTRTAAHRSWIVPPYLLARIAVQPELGHAAVAARRTLDRDAPFREFRCTDEHPPSPPAVRAETAPVDRRPGHPYRRISDAGRTEVLPGRLVRSEGEPDTGDEAVTEAYDGLGDMFGFLFEAYGRDSIDGAGMPLDATVHYGRDYDNAFWDGERMVFGDGDGEIFVGFTNSLSVIGHELAHGVTERTANLRYQGQSGALNEHVSDVFGALLEQYVRRQEARDASWLIGEGLFTDQVEGEAIRSMIAPGTAYDDDVLGRDPQPAHLRDYIVTTDDNGGVHLNSGIPNRAFVVAALRLGGPAWERAGRVWYDTLTSDRIGRDTDFAGFAAATRDAARARFGDTSAEALAVAEGWAEVGVLAG